MIHGCDEAHFKRHLQEYFNPAQPISQPDHLHGRSQKLKAIERALASPGKHVFIYGDRGIGKTSLAKTAAQLFNPDIRHIPFIACEGSATVEAILDSLCRQIMLCSSEVLHPDIHISGIQPNLPTNLDHMPKNINEAISFLKHSVSNIDKTFVVILDEFDHISDVSVKKFVADFLKQISDQYINIMMIICGIGRSLEDLIGVHLSTDHYVAAIELEQISHDAR